MAIRIVTDSLADITGNLTDELGISVVPVYVRFGDQVYKDRIEITTDEFYHRLTHDSIWPSTTQPTRSINGWPKRPTKYSLLLCQIN